MLEAIKVLSPIEMSKMVLVSKSKNRPNQPVYKEELPSVLHGRSPRQKLGYSWFSKYTESLDKVKVCQGCGRALLSQGEKHETYGLYKANVFGETEYLIKLEGVLKLCRPCHRSIHSGFSTHLAMTYGSLPLVAPESRAMKVGSWSKAKYLLVENNLYLL